MLIFKEVFDEEQENYETDKCDEHPFDTFVIFLVKAFVFFVHPYHDANKNNDKEHSKYSLTGWEHTFYYFPQN